MKQKLLAIMPESLNYLPCYAVSSANSFHAAVGMIIAAEEAGSPFDTLDISVRDEAQYQAFLNWMEQTGRNYPFSIFGCPSTVRFWQLCQEARDRGFRFNT